jgi:multiple sugar transport system substrate-binding protein
VTVKHDPIDFPGQVQKTTATLAGDSGSYDILETYSFVIPDFGSKQKLVPLDDLFAKYSEKYKLGDLDESMVKAMSYEGKMYGVPMQAQTHVLAYRKDLFDKNGITPPTTFEEMKAAAKKLQDAEGMKYPIALPWLASGDIGTAYRAALSSLGKFYVDPSTKKPTFDSPEAAKAFEEMKDLLPYMDPQVTTFDQPKVQQQLFNGTAAMGIMFSGRMVDLTKPENTKFASSFAFAPPPSVVEGGKTFGTLSVDGWSIPFNTKVDKDLCCSS